MKKLILFISLFGLFILASCDKKPDSDITTSSIQTTESNQQSSESSDSESESNESKVESESSLNSEESSSESALPDYDDGSSWKGSVF